MKDAADAGIRVFFIHVRKTGGTTLWNWMSSLFPSEDRYGSDATDMADRIGLYTNIDRLAALDPAECSRLRFFSGHFPFAAASLVGPPLTTVTLLRDPVARTISYLKQCQRVNPEHRGSSLEEIYEDVWFHPRLIENHQTKVFAMTTQEMLQPNTIEDWRGLLPDAAGDERGHLDDRAAVREAIAAAANCTRKSMLLFGGPMGTARVKVDRDRLEKAKVALRTVDVVGVSEQSDDFVRRLQQRFGTGEIALPAKNVGHEQPASVELVQRIADENWADIELHELARELGESL